MNAVLGLILGSVQYWRWVLGPVQYWRWDSLVAWLGMRIELLKLKKIQTEKSTTNNYKNTLRDCNTQGVINNHGTTTTRALHVQTRNTSTPQNTSTLSILNMKPRSESALSNTGRRVTWGTDIPNNNTKTKFYRLMRQRHKEPERLQKWLTAVTTATKRISAINRRLTHKSSRTLF